MNAKVSIIIPLFNYEMYVEDCLKSCMNQTYNNVEVIVVDDHSTDKSVNKVRKIIEEYGDRIKLICLDSNKGYSHAKNVGISNSDSEFISHLDADDMLTIDSIEIRIKEFDEDSELDFVHGLGLEFFGDSSYEWCCKNISKLNASHVKIHAQGVLLKRKNYEKYGLYDETLRSRGDKEMWLRLMNLGSIKMKKIEHPVAFYRRHKTSMSNRRSTDKTYAKMVNEKFEESLQKRHKQGITKENTLFLSL